MALTNAQIVKKFHQHENEILAIYDALVEIQSKLGAHDARFDSVDARFDSVDATLAEILRRLPEAS